MGEKVRVGRFERKALKYVYSVQSLSCVWLFATPRIAAPQASLSITNSRRSLRLKSIESVMPSSHLILWRPLLLLPSIPPNIRIFSNESALRMRWPKLGVSASTSVLPMNTQDWSPLGLTSLILEKEMATNSSTLAGKSHGQRSLVGYRPQSRKELDTTEVKNWCFWTAVLERTLESPLDWKEIQPSPG